MKSLDVRIDLDFRYFDNSDLLENAVQEHFKKKKKKKKK